MQEIRAASTSGAQTGLHCFRVGTGFETHRSSHPQAHPNHGPFPHPSPSTPQTDVPTRTITYGGTVIPPQAVSQGPFHPRPILGHGYWPTDLCVSELLVSFLLFFFFFPEAQNCFLKRPTVSFSPAPWPPATLSGAQNVPGVPGALPLYGLCSTAPHSWHQQWLTPGTTGDSGSPGPSSRTLLTALM